ncbi:MAG: aspartate aminotransferase family protein [Bacteroidales bacterium]|nr:aspartate aminotransferase family protein [Bacteroidales bacterium]
MLTTRQLFQLHLGLPSIEIDPIEIVGSKGIYLIDSEGNKLIDLVSGVSVSNVGHLHPRVVHAINTQLESYMHIMVYGKFVQSPQVMLAAKLAENLPQSLDSVYFVNSGSEAIEGALKLAKRITGRTELIGFKDAYHGGTAGALSLLGNETLKNAFRPLLPDTRMLRFNNFDDLNQITDQTACVLVEPVQAEAGIILPKKAYLEAIRERCNETGALLIFDEIQMGMGRTGRLFAFENYNIVPDILCLAKALGGGMPIGAFISSKKNMSTLTFNPELGHITTFGGHPVCCAAALAAFDVLFEEKLIVDAASKGMRYVNALKSHRAISEIRQIGLMLGVEVTQRVNINLLMKIFKKNHLVVDQFLFNENAFRIAPPLTITMDEIDLSLVKIIQSLDEALAN